MSKNDQIAASHRVASSRGRLMAPDVLRGMAILGVVACHAFAYLALPSDGAWGAFLFIVNRLGVPAFFLADGYLHAMRYRDAPARADTLIAATRRLMLPWAIYSVFYLLLRISFERFGNAAGHPALSEGFIIALWRGVAAGQLYFLPALLMVRCATILLHPLVRGRAVASASLSLLLVFGWRLGLEPVTHAAAFGTEPTLVALGGIGFASIGWTLAECGIRNVRRLGFLLALMFVLGAMLTEGRVEATFAQLAIVMFAWDLAERGDGSLSRGLSWLGQRTMQIFVLHGPLLMKPVIAVLLALELPHMPSFLLTVLMATAGALGLAALLSRAGLAWTWNGTWPISAGYRKIWSLLDR